MKDLIEALQIFAKYQTETYCQEYPTCCVHDVLLIMGVSRNQPTLEDAKRLDELDFFWSDEHGCWGSFRFGSA